MRGLSLKIKSQNFGQAPLVERIHMISSACANTVRYISIRAARPAPTMGDGPWASCTARSDSIRHFRYTGTSYASTGESHVSQGPDVTPGHVL